MPVGGLGIPVRAQHTRHVGHAVRFFLRHINSNPVIGVTVKSDDAGVVVRQPGRLRALEDFCRLTERHDRNHENDGISALMARCHAVATPGGKSSA